MHENQTPSGKYDIPVVTTDTITGHELRCGTIIHATAVSGANILRDIREAVTNTLGGKMSRYERLLDTTIDRAIASLATRAADAGYNAVVAVRISHPVITDGAIEIVATGTGVWFDAPDTSQPG